MKEGICKSCKKCDEVFDDNGICYTCWKGEHGIEKAECKGCKAMTWLHSSDGLCSFCRPENIGKR